MKTYSKEMLETVKPFIYKNIMALQKHLLDKGKTGKEIDEHHNALYRLQKEAAKRQHNVFYT